MGSRVKLDLLLLLSLFLLFSPVFSDLVLTKVDRSIDLTSQVVRITTNLKVENKGNDPVSSFLLAFPDAQSKYLAFLSVNQIEGKGKTKGQTVNLTVQLVEPEGMPDAMTFFSVSLQKELVRGKILTFEVLAVFTQVLKPFPEEITQDSYHLVVYQDSAYYLSPYAVETQTLTVKLPEGRIESYTKVENTKTHGPEIKYGPYKNSPPFTFSLIVVHFEDNQPFAVAQKLVREIEISHWGSVQVREHYYLTNRGARLKGEFSRLDYQSHPQTKGATSFSRLLARLPPVAHSVYFRDEIGNISTSHLWNDLKKTDLEIGPRFPLFGGWKTYFMIGYCLPLADYLFVSEGTRFLNFSFGSPVKDLVADELILEVILPEGSRIASVSVPFSVKHWQETRQSHLDISGRPTVIIQKSNAVPEHNQHFQVYYKFSSISLLREPLMLISGFFLFFIACILYVHTDVTISKSSASYLAKLQLDEVRTVIQQLQNIIHQCLAIHDKLEASLRDLSRTGNVQSCKTARKSADSLLKELSKDLKPLLASLQSNPQAAQILPKVEELTAKERELQERIMTKHTVVVDCYEKKIGGREIESRVAPHQQKITSLKLEVDELVEFVDEF